MSRASIERFGKRSTTNLLAQKMDEKNKIMREMSTTMHRTGMTANLLRLFTARPAPPYEEPGRRRKPLLRYTGVGSYLSHLSKPETSEHKPPGETKDVDDDGKFKKRLFVNPEYALQCRIEGPTRLERIVEKMKAKAKENEVQIEEAIADWDPQKDPNADGDPLKTLFVANLSYDVSERKLRREFEEFGPIRGIRLVHDKHSGKPRGYAFIEFEHKSDMKEAYKVADGRRIEGRRCTVDVERGRTVPGWKPRRFGGGKGEKRAPILPKDPKKQRISSTVNEALGIMAVRGGEGLRGGMGDGRDHSQPPRDRYRDSRPPRRDSYSRERSDRDDFRRGGKDRYREHDRRDYDRRDSRDERRGSREDYGRKRERSPYRGGGDDRFVAIPPPTVLGGQYDTMDYDEPEEGEYPASDSKRRRD